MNLSIHYPFLYHFLLFCFQVGCQTLSEPVSECGLIRLSKRVVNKNLIFFAEIVFEQSQKTLKAARIEAHSAEKRRRPGVSPRDSRANKNASAKPKSPQSNLKRILSI